MTVPSSAWLALLLCLAPAAAAAQGSSGKCPWAPSPSATIGIDRLLCRGGPCEINLETREGLAHRFSTEPVISRLRPDAPGALAEGDVIVAVDGALITTREGGRRLADLVVAEPVTLTLRRDGRMIDVALIPVPGCPIGGLTVRSPG
jgi:S1-C subfamily serine protease